MIDFLNFIHPPDPLHQNYIEIRYTTTYGMSQDFAKSAADAALLAMKWPETPRDIYYGVLPRLDKRGRAQDCPDDSTVLWADLDAKHNALGKKGCLDALLTFPVPASVIVDSGHGYHAYWKLDKAYAFPDCQKAMKGIAKHLGGDAVYDQPRVLRLPGTHNHKDAIPLPVRTIRLDETRTYGLDDFDEWVHEPPKPKYEGWHNPYPRTDGVDLGADHVYTLAQERPADGSRSEAIFRLILTCLRNGWEPQEIVELIMLNPIGEKARGKGPEAGRRYLERSIAKAQRG